MDRGNVVKRLRKEIAQKENCRVGMRKQTGKSKEGKFSSQVSGAWKVAPAVDKCDASWTRVIPVGC